MSERFNEAVLKTVEGNTSGGSNPSLSAKNWINIVKALNMKVLRAFLIIYPPNYINLDQVQVKNSVDVGILLTKINLIFQRVNIVDDFK